MSLPVPVNHTLHAVGLGRALKYYKHKGVSISSQGESSVSEGYCYEAINGASKEKLPVIFVFQDNGYGISVPKRDQTANERISDNFRGFANLHIIKVNGLDVFESLNAMREAKQIATEKSIPVIVDAEVVRIGSHSNSDKHELYRDEAERNEALAKDPLPKFRETLLSRKDISEKELTSLDEEAKAEVLDAHVKAMKAPNPDPESIYDFVIPEAHECKEYPEGTHNHHGEPITMIQALITTLKEMFRENPDTFIWGQDMANKDKGGIFNVSKGMQQEFGIERVFKRSHS